MKACLTFFTSIFMFFNLCAQNRVYDVNGDSKSITREDVDLEFLDEGFIIPGKEKIESAFSLITILPKAVELGFKAVGDALKKREKSFTGEYEIQKGNLKVGIAKVPSLVFRREVAFDDSSDEPQFVPALEVKLKANGIEELPGGMYYSIEYIKLVRSKARTTSKNNKLDYSIDIKLSFLIFNDGKATKEVLELNTIRVPYVHFNTEGFLKIDQFISDIIIVPRGSRLAEVGLKIIESNPAKVQAGKISSLFEEHKETATTIINNFLPKEKGDAEPKKTENPVDDKKNVSQDPNKSTSNKD